MNSRRIGNEDAKAKRTKLIRKIVQTGSEEGSLSTRKSQSPQRYQEYQTNTASKNNIANSIIMRRQLNALSDAASFKDNNKIQGNLENERKILQQISKSKTKINPPSPNKKIRKYFNSKILNGDNDRVRDVSFNSTIKNAKVNQNGIYYPQPELENMSTHRSTKRKSRKNGYAAHVHNKSLVVDSFSQAKEGLPKFINDFVSKISVSNNIIVVSNENELNKVKNTMNLSNSSLISTPKNNKNQDAIPATTAKVTENLKQNYLVSKHSIVEKKPESLLQSFDKADKQSFQLKFPEVSNLNSQNMPSTSKNIDKNKKNYIRFEQQNEDQAKPKILPSITTKKDLGSNQTKKPSK